ncbi:hypothetical protein [Anditalea andensis]|uniref:Uncharacterized protein n=1 Tax=Anditalea andensis TaxID=1048983 RepID=A0A074KUS5_9BACT|nr:hypothetical protein [Anditalea andensis]KEO73721.1 hypothetical protein EL17_10870 [Anditalea andensis]
MSPAPKRNYNLHKSRRNPANNAGNYITAQVKFVSQGLIQRSGDMDLPPISPPIQAVLITEVHLGLQRSISNRLFFIAKIGVGYLLDFHQSSSTILCTGGV